MLLMLILASLLQAARPTPTAVWAPKPVKIETVGSAPSLRFELNVSHAKTLFPRDQSDGPPSMAAPGGMAWTPVTVNRVPGQYDQFNQPHLNIHDAAAKNEKYTGGRFV